MQHLFPRTNNPRWNLALLPFSFGLLLAALATLGAPQASPVRAGNPAIDATPPCSTCAEAIGLDAFRAATGGDVLPVLVELNEPSGLMRKISAENNGQGIAIPELMAHAATLHGRQRAFIASLPARGVRALLREHDARQV